MSFAYHLIADERGNMPHVRKFVVFSVEAATLAPCVACAEVDQRVITGREVSRALAAQVDVPGDVGRRDGRRRGNVDLHDD